MSRIGNQPVIVPASVNVKLSDSEVEATGPKGTLKVSLLDTVKVSQSGEELIFSRVDESKKSKSEHGLMRSLVANIVEGVEKGFTKKLEVNGVGFKTNLSGKKLTMQLGFSHPIEYMLPEGVDAVVEDNKITITGADKQQVGQVAAEIRAFKKPEPYKGKGIKYEDEQIKRKAGKTAGAE